VASLSRRFLEPLDGRLARYPKGRKGYNGRVERSHRSDDEEFYRPYLLELQDTQEHLLYAHRWEYFYNVLRPHLGEGMEQSPPLAVLQRLGYTGSQAIASFPPVLLDNISTDLLMACAPSDGNDLLAHYKFLVFEKMPRFSRSGTYDAEKGHTDNPSLVADPCRPEWERLPYDASSERVFPHPHFWSGGCISIWGQNSLTGRGGRV